MKITRPLTSYNNRIRETTLSPSYQPNYRATPLTCKRNAWFTQEMRGGTSATLITLNTNTKTLTKTQKSKMSQKKKEMLKWLSEENPPALDILKKVADCPTPYSKLILKACEELSYSLGPVRSEGVDELERNSAIQSAKVDVEIQQQQEKLLKTIHENKSLESQISDEKENLESLNTQIDNLQRLSTLIGGEREVKEIPKPKTTDTEAHEIELFNDGPELDNSEYRQLWNEQMTLEGLIQILQTGLKAKQLEQVKEMKKYIYRKYPSFHNLPS